MQKNSPMGHPMRQLIMGTVLMLFFGLIYAWSVFAVPIEKDLNWIRSQTTLVFSSSMFSFCMGSILGGLYRKKPRILLAVCACLFLAGFLAASQSRSLAWACLSYGLLCGTGVGLGYNVLLSSVSKWFPDRSGICSGTLLLGFGFGALLLGMPVNNLIGASGWRTAFVILAGVFACITGLGALFLRIPGEKEIINPMPLNTAPELSPKEIIRKKVFWFGFTRGILTVTISLTIIGNVVHILTEYNVSPRAAVSMVGLISVANGMSRFLFGIIFDKYGRRKALLWSILVILTALPILLVSGLQKNQSLMIFSFILIGIGYGGSIAIGAPFVRQMFGNRNFSINLAVYNLNMVFASSLSQICGGILRVQFGTYTGVFGVLLALGIIAVFLTMLIIRE